MRKYLGLWLLVVVFFMSGCASEEPIDCGEDYYSTNGICLRIPRLDYDAAKRSSIKLITDNEYCTIFGIDNNDCDDFKSDVEAIGSVFDENTSTYHFEQHDDSSFQLVVFYTEQEKVVDVTGQLYLSDSYELQIKDFEYSIQANVPVQEEDVEIIFREFLLNKEESTFCDTHNLKYNYNVIQCNEFKESSLLAQLDDINQIIIGDNGETYINLVSSEISLITAEINFDIYQYDGEFYLQFIRYVDNTTHYFSADQIKDYYETMFEGGFIGENLTDFCQTPIQNYMDDEYTVDVTRCNYSIQRLSDTEITVEVFGFNYPGIDSFNVHISEVNGDSALLFMTSNYLDDTHIRVSKIRILEDSAVSIFGAERFISDFLNDYLLDPEQASLTYFDEFGRESLDIDPNLVSVDTLTVAWGNGGLFGASFDVTVIDDISDETYEFSMVIEFVEDELKFTGFYTGNFFD